MDAKGDTSRQQTSYSQDDISSMTSMVSGHGSGAAAEEAIAPAEAPELPESQSEAPIVGALAGLTPMKAIESQSGFIARTTREIREDWIAFGWRHCWQTSNR